MKYSKGDKVRIQYIEWYDEMLSIPSKLVWQNKLTEDFIGIWCGSHVFMKEMCEFCGKVMTIQEVGIDFYLMEEDKMGYKFTDEMILGVDVNWIDDDKTVAERFGDVGITLSTPKFKIDDRVETNDDLFGYITEVIYDEKVYCYKYYVSFIVDGGYYYENQLKLYKKESDSIVPKFKVGDVIVKKDGLTTKYLVVSVSNDYYGLSLSSPNSNGVGVLPVKDQDEWELLSDSNAEDIVNSHYEDELEEMAKSHNKDILNDLYNLGMENSRKEAIKLGISEHIVCPDGYEFRDGDGNLIAVEKIVLVKKGLKYPQSYKECREILKVGKEHTLEGEILRNNDYKIELLVSFQKLLICRDAYWHIAGEEMGLGKSWEPTMETVYCISRNNNVMKCSYRGGKSNILEFPTEEMRDAFYEAFKDLIEECKELL